MQAVTLEAPWQNAALNTLRQKTAGGVIIPFPAKPVRGDEVAGVHAPG